MSQNNDSIMQTKVFQVRYFNHTNHTIISKEILVSGILKQATYLHWGVIDRATN